MTVVVTRDVEDRYRGFLSSCMLEISAGVYVAPAMSKGIRDRVWLVISGWHEALGRGSIVMIWPEKASVGGVSVLLMGTPLKDIVDVDGMYLVRTPS